MRIYSRARPTASGKCRTNFDVADYTSGIRRLRVFTDPAEAKREAGKIARQLAAGESTAATLRHPALTLLVESPAVFCPVSMPISDAL